MQAANLKKLNLLPPLIERCKVKWNNSTSKDKIKKALVGLLLNQNIVISAKIYLGKKVVMGLRTILESIVTKT